MLIGWELFYMVGHSTYQLQLAERSQQHLETKVGEIYVEN